ncbi:hypothetical protein MLD38_028868 [Melastoma candidum]|uniref:Uncharacterized protein n=1 Tax=Melastoma candidum TaxID=119954 RepID=A0ACB9N2D4_9MYRT|nr:hypothetical protein MLD38_028868 [Melastoma candidum]
MVMNASTVERVAHASATLCQFIACNPERFSSDRVLYLIFCFPFQNLRRLGRIIRSCFCLPPVDSSSDSSSDGSGRVSSGFHSD